MSKSFCIKLLSIIFISALGIIVYSNSFSCSFHFDDQIYIINNSAIRDIQDLLNIWGFCPCRFVTFLSIAFNYYFHQLDVFWYHLFNLLVHLISATLVWWLVLLTLSTPAMKDPACGGVGNKITQHVDLIALFAGLVFVSHPVQTEAVTYIWQRAASMATLFYLASLCLYIKSRLLQADATSSGLYYILSLIMAMVAMFTKEISITLPLMILLYEISFFRSPRSLFVLKQPNEVEGRIDRHSQLFAIGPFGRGIVPFLLTLIIIPLTMVLTKSERFQEIRNVIEVPGGISPMHYLLTQFRVMITYVRLVFLPFDQNLDYDYPIFKNIFELPVLISFLSLIAILFCARRLFSKYRLVSFSIFWFFLTLLPESSILPQSDVIFEHRLYLPMVGYSIFLVSGVYYFFGKNSIKLVLIVLMMIITFNSILTYQRNKVWKNEITLWDDAVQKSPHKARPYYNRGNAYDKKGNITRATPDYTKAIELNPNYYDAYIDRGLIYYKEGKVTQAMSDYNKAIEINPNYYDAYIDRGLIYSKQGNVIKAISDYNKAIEINLNLAGAYINRGLIYYKQGDLKQAMSDYKKTIELNPNYYDAYINLGLIYSKQGKVTQAMSDYNKAIEIDPDLAGVYINRGLIYYSQGKVTQAMSDYNKAIEINPNFAGAYYNRGLIYYSQGEITEAMSDFNKAIEINPDYADVYNNRGRAYDELGNFTQAISDFTRAIELNPDYYVVYYNRGIIYAKQGNFIQALFDFSRVIELNHNYANAYYDRAVTYYQLNEYDKAWADVHKAEELGYYVNPQLISVLKQASKY